MITLTVNDIKKQANQLNDKALNTTEKVFLSVFDKIEEAQKKTDKFLKKGLKKSAKNQDKFFDALEKGKDLMSEKAKKVKKLVSKK